jgi:uncharacterized membrane protein YfhO
LTDRQTRNFELVSSDVFGNQNRLLAHMLGEYENPYFVRMSYTDKRPENLEFKQIGDYRSYERTAENVNAHIQYDFTAEADGDVFLYFPSGFERKTNLWLQRYVAGDREDTSIQPSAEFIGQMYETDHHHIQYIGHFLAGEEFMVTVSLPNDGTIMYFRDEIFMRLDHERLEADVERIHQMNANTTFTAVNNRRLRITTNHAEDMLLFTSIPTEPGWRAYVNGERVRMRGSVNWVEHIPAVLCDTEKDSDGNFVVLAEAYDIRHSGFLAVDAPAGENVIELRFFPHLMPFGIVLSIAGVIGLLLIGLVMKAMSKESRAIAAAKNDESEDLSELPRSSAVEEILAEIGIDMDAGEKSQHDIIAADEYEGFDSDYIDDDSELD